MGCRRRGDGELRPAVWNIEGAVRIGWPWVGYKTSAHPTDRPTLRIGPPYGSAHPTGWAHPTGKIRTRPSAMVPSCTAHILHPRLSQLTPHSGTIPGCQATSWPRASAMRCRLGPGLATGGHEQMHCVVGGSGGKIRGSFQSGPGKAFSNSCHGGPSSTNSGKMMPSAAAPAC